MHETKLGDFLASGGFWGHVQTLEPFPFFATYPPANMDAVMLLKYGERVVLPKLVNVPKEQIAAMVVDLFKDKWDKLILVNSANLDILAANERHISETVQNENDITRNSDNVNKVSAYNETALIDDSGANTTEETAEVGNTTRELTEKVRGYSDVYANLDTSQKLAIISLATLDVVNTISLTVY